MLGHNVGINEYGDESCVMGHGTEFVSVNAPNRLKVGWIKEENVIRFTEEDLQPLVSHEVVLLKLSHQPHHARYHTALQLPRIGGGTYVVSFRFGERIAEAGAVLSRRERSWKHHVSVHAIDEA